MCLHHFGITTMVVDEYQDWESRLAMSNRQTGSAMKRFDTSAMSSIGSMFCAINSFMAAPHGITRLIDIKWKMARLSWDGCFLSSSTS